MDMGNRASGRTRIVLFGMRCTFTQPVLAALAEEAGIDLLALVLPGSASTPTTDDPVQGFARATRTSVLEIAGRSQLGDADFRETIERLEPNVIIVACFPWRLPQWLLDFPSGGCLNLHPSLLPDGRGPEPVFWAFRRGLEETGVTLHVMDEGFDTGPVVSQRRYAIPDHATMPDLERALAETGAEMVIEHLNRFNGGPPAATAQRKGTSLYAPVPRPEDFVVPTSWMASHAARFIRGVGPVYGAIPVIVQATGQRLLVDQVIGIDEGEQAATPVVVEGGTARIRLADGTLTCRVVHSQQVLHIHRPGG